MDFQRARTNMVQSQLLPNRILDRRLIRRLKEVARETFVAPGYRDFAYSDMVLPQDGERQMLKPLQTAWLIEALELAEGDKVLVVGAGTGYEVALLAGMGVSVFALESKGSLAAKGRELVTDGSVQWKVGDLASGWPEESPFDGILLTGAVPEVSNKLIGQLGKKGKLVAVLGRKDDAVMRAVRMVSICGGDRPEPLFETVAPMLPGFEAADRFQL